MDSIQNDRRVLTHIKRREPDFYTSLMRQFKHVGKLEAENKKLKEENEKLKGNLDRVEKIFHINNGGLFEPILNSNHENRDMRYLVELDHYNRSWEYGNSFVDALLKFKIL